MQLDHFNPERLLWQLKSGKFDDALASLAGPKCHLDVYQSYALQRDERAGWFACLKVLIEKKVPFVLSGRVSLMSAIVDFHLESTPDMSRELLRLYGEAGMVNVHEPIPERFLTVPGTRSAVRGLMPLTAAVRENNALAVELFLNLGACEEVVNEDGSSRTVYEYALERGATRVLAFLSERAMRIALSETEAAATEAAARINRRMGL